LLEVCEDPCEAGRRVAELGTGSAVWCAGKEAELASCGSCDIWLSIQKK